MGAGQASTTTRRSWFLGAAIWAATFCSGFGALAVFWMARDWPTNVPGWTDYRASIVGDGALIPTLVAVAYWASAMLPPRRGDTPALLVGAVGGALCGAAVQWSWLSDEHPHLNWSMVRPHHFTAPGWYHAVFLTAATATIGALAARLAARMARAVTLPGAKLIAFTAVGFALLQSTDALYPAGYEAPPGQSPGGIVSAVATVATVCAALFWLRPRGKRGVPMQHPSRGRCSDYTRSVVLGGSLALVLAAVCLPWPAANWLRLALALGAVTAIGVADKRRVGYHDRAYTSEPELSSSAGRG